VQHERGDRTARRASLEHPPSGPLAAASYLIRARGTDRVVIEVSVGTQVLLLSQPTDVVEPLRLALWVHCRHGDVGPSSRPNPIASPPALRWDLRLSSGAGRGGPKRYD
jgi:hypothetical protein